MVVKFNNKNETKLFDKRKIINNSKNHPKSKQIKQLG